MQSRSLGTKNERSWVLVFDTGEEVTDGLLDFCREQQIISARLTAIGALQEVELGWFNLETKDYERNRLNEQVEVLSLVGNVAVFEKKPKVHVHLVIGRRDGSAHGGHLLKGIVRPTLEVMLKESPAHLQRQTDPETGLALLTT